MQPVPASVRTGTSYVSYMGTVLQGTYLTPYSFFSSFQISSSTCTRSSHSFPATTTPFLIFGIYIGAKVDLRCSLHLIYLTQYSHTAILYSKDRLVTHDKSMLNYGGTATTVENCEYLKAGTIRPYHSHVCAGHAIYSLTGTSVLCTCAVRWRASRYGSTSSFP